jgi:hypothetical protein
MAFLYDKSVPSSDVDCGGTNKNTNNQAGFIDGVRLAVGMARAAFPLKR